MILFVLGNGRSGTTLLDVYIRQEYNAFSLGEVNAFYFPYRKHHYTIDCNCGNADCEFWTSVDRGNIWSVYDEALSLGETLIVDSSKNLHWNRLVTKVAKRNNVETMCVLIHKPLKEYFYSIWKRGESMNAAALRYSLYHMRLMGSQIKFTRINYRAFVEGPSVTLSNFATIENGFMLREKNNSVNSHHIFGSDSVRGSGRTELRAELPNYNEEFEVEWDVYTRSTSFYLVSLIENFVSNQRRITLPFLGIFKLFWSLYMIQGFFKNYKKH